MQNFSVAGNLRDEVIWVHKEGFHDLTVIDLNLGIVVSTILKTSVFLRLPQGTSLLISSSKPSSYFISRMAAICGVSPAAMAPPGMPNPRI